MFPRIRKTRITIIAFFLTCLFALAYIHTRGFIPHDEGWILNPAERFLSGEIPYKDFHFIYPPVPLFYAAFFFSLFGKSVLVARLSEVGLAFGTTILLYACISYLTKKWLLGILAATIYILWDPLHINFLWPVNFAIPAGIGTMFFLILGRRKKQTLFFVLAGICCSLTLLSKQNFGFAILMSSLIALCFYKTQRLNRILFYCIGVLLGVLPFLLYLLYTASLVAFVQDMYYFLIDKALIHGMQHTPLIYPGPFLWQIGKTLFYFSPFLFGLFSLILCIQKKAWDQAAFSIFVILFFLVGFRPTTDYVHLIPIIALSGIPLSFIISQSKKQYIKALSFLCIFGLISFGIYDILFRPYFRWDAPILRHNEQMALPKLGVLVDIKSKNALIEANTIVQKKTKPDDFLFIYQYLPLYYFVLDRKNPTRFDYLPPLNRSDEQEIIQDLERKPVPLILTQYALDADESVIGKYIKKHYQPTQLRYFYYWEKVK